MYEFTITNVLTICESFCTVNWALPRLGCTGFPPSSKSFPAPECVKFTVCSISIVALLEPVPVAASDFSWQNNHCYWDNYKSQFLPPHQSGLKKTTHHLKYTGVDSYQSDKNNETQYGACCQVLLELINSSRV